MSVGALVIIHTVVCDKPRRATEAKGFTEGPLRGETPLAAHIVSHF